MVYKFLIISDESDDFLRKIAIDSDATFFDLHNAILDSVGYQKNLLTSFFICTDDWEKETEITLEEMDVSYDRDNWVMRNTKLSDLITDEGQRLIYVFDNMSERAFFMELKEVETGKSLTTPQCLISKGEPPVQEMDFDELAAMQSFSENNDELFYGDEDYNIDELDNEGYDLLDTTNGNPYGDDY